MKQFISSRSLVLFCLVAIRISCCLSPCEAQTFTLAPDSTITGPFQSVRVNVVDNDIVPCTNYTLSVTSFNGTGIAKDTLGNYIVYHPAKYDTPPTVGDTTVVSINYLVTCGTTSKTSTLKVKVTKYNDPANLIPSNVTCFSYMPSNVTFGIKRKYTTSLNGTSEPARDNAIDAYQAPLVGDLNGDGKPEIVATGIYGTDNGSSHRINHVNIFDGQDGTRKIRFTLSNLGADYGPFYVGKPYHRAPSIMAIADLIPGNDNISEIVVCNAYPGRVFALKPVFNGTNITTLTKEWDGKDHNGNIVRFNEPLTGNKDWVGAEGKFQYPHPYIADINGDGIPEVIVYNKIYNGATGKLLMSWRDAATSQTGKVSSVDGAGSLSDQSFDSPMTQENAAKIRNVAMTGRRPGNGRYADKDLAVPAIVDIDGDGQQEIITGNRIHKFQFNSLTDHTQNTYTTIEGPLSVDLPVTPGSSNKTKFYLSDGHTRVADIDGDGVLDIIVVSYVNNGSLNVTAMVYVWDLRDLTNVKAACSYWSQGEHGNISIPFIGDINGKTDGPGGKRLPEICILGGGIYIDRSTAYNGRSGIQFHPMSDANLLTGKFNRARSTTEGNFNGHVIGLTYDHNATAVEDKLKLSWGMEHSDRSNSTGITLFDFDNNGTMDLCYRDETRLRVISPKRANGGAGSDYIKYDEVVNANSSVMFEQTAYSGTGFEYPSIADVNMDGSADIVVTVAHKKAVDATRGWVEVFEYSGAKWAACPPVWNQSMYDPRQIREDLKINAAPVPMLTEFWNPVGNISVQPYNGSWMQRPIMKAGDYYMPVVRFPEAAITNMKVTVSGAPHLNAAIQLTIRNKGSASISAATPISFYTGGTAGDALANSSYIGQKPVGRDIFPDETVTLTYNISHTSSLNNNLIWARIMANNKEFPAMGFDDCDTSNNAMDGADCPYLIVTTKVYPSADLCGSNAAVKLSVVNANQYSTVPIFQWYDNDVPIANANDSVLYVSAPGYYNCRVKDKICIARTNYIKVTLGFNPSTALELEGSPTGGLLCASGGSILISPKSIAGYINPQYSWYRDNLLLPGQTAQTLNATSAGLYRLNIVTNGCILTDTFRVTQTNHTAPGVGLITVPGPMCANTNPSLSAPTVSDGGGTIISQGWELSVGKTSYGTYSPFDPASTAITEADNGKYLRYKATNHCNTSYSFPVQISVVAKPTISAKIGAIPAVCEGNTLALPSMSGKVNTGGAAITESWQIEDGLSLNTYADMPTIPYVPALADHGLRIRYRASNRCGDGYSDTVAISVVAPPTAGTFGYNGGSAICSSAAGTISPVWSQSPTGGTGKYSAVPPGLDINTVSGAITPGTSTPNTYTVTYTIPAGTCPQVTRNASVTVNVCTNLILTSIISPQICENAPDTIFVTAVNHSSVPATGIKVKELFPTANLVFVSAHPSTGSYVNDEWNIGTLAAGVGALLKIAVRGRKAGTSVANQVYVSEVNGIFHANYSSATIKHETVCEVKSTPTVSVRANKNICLGDTVHIFKVTGGTSPWTVTYNDGTTNQSVILTSNPVHVFQPAVIGTSTFRNVRVSSANGCNSSSAVTSTITTGIAPTVSPFTLDTVCSGEAPKSGGIPLGTFTPQVTPNHSTVTSEGWRIETTPNIFQDFTYPFTLTYADDNKRIYYTATNACGTGTGTGTGTGDTTRIHVRPDMVYPDIRLQLCPLPSRSIYLSSYLDTFDIKQVEWSVLSSGSPTFATGTDVTTGELPTNKLSSGVHIYKYRIKHDCGTSTAKAFVKSTLHPTIRNMSDTLVICQCMPLSSRLQLNQMLGLEANGTWAYDNALSSYVTISPSSSRFFGARILDATAAWSALHGQSGFKFPYGTDPDAALFKFTYTASASNPSLGNISRELVLIVMCTLHP